MIASLMFMISYNVAQLATLTSETYNIDDIFFVGNFVKNNHFAKEKLTFGVELNAPGGKRRPLFMTYDGFLGAIGAFL